MNFLKLFSKKSNLPSISNREIIESFQIPEPTKSLLFITDENPSKISSPLQIKITINLSNSGIETDVDNGHNFYGEPSLIWTKLTVIKNSEMEEKPMYYPEYSSLSPKHRYQYLNWLRDITQPTNLSYVFLYYYGLERHLLVGNFDFAVSEIFRLLKNHNKGTFRSYAQNALIVSALHKKRLDIFDNSLTLADGVSNESLLIKKGLGHRLTSDDLIKLAYSVGFKNNRYIKLYPSEFKSILGEFLKEYQNSNGSILESVSSDELSKSDSIVFANTSIPEHVRTIKVPQIISNNKFKNTCIDLLQKTHDNLKFSKKKK
jgi:hypothetical protein